MTDAETRARIRRLFYAEHWRIGTISAELGVHHTAVRNAIELDRFAASGAQLRPTMLAPTRASSRRSSTTIHACARRACSR